MYSRNGYLASASVMERVAIQALALNREVILSAVHRIAKSCPREMHSGSTEAIPRVQFLDDRCRVESTEIGRALVVTEELEGGTTLLKEFPQIAVPSYTCNCSFGDILLPEHLELAWRVFSGDAHCSENFILASLCSGNSGAYEAKSKFVSNQWPLHVFLLMITSCYICVSFHQKGNSALSRVRCSTIQLCDILSRVPQNAHAVTAVRSNGTGYLLNEVNEERVAIALFTLASCVNHSCQPNCAVIFQRSEHQSPFNYELRLVTLSNIEAGAEIRMSYGVATGQHAISLRRKILQKQYLFTCNCEACLRDLKITDSDQRSDHRAAAEMLYSLAVEIEQRIIDIRNSKTPRNVRSDILLVQGKIERLKNEHLHLVAVGAVDLEFWRIRAAMLQCSMLDVSAYWKAAQQKFKEASQDVEAAIEILLGEGIYGERDVPIGREFWKLSELFQEAGERHRAKECGERAFLCLHSFVSSEDPDLCSLLQCYPELFTAVVALR